MSHAEQAQQRNNESTSAAPIVVATDLSPVSTAALVAADQRSRASGAPLIICHVLPESRGLVTPLFPQDSKLLVDSTEHDAAIRSIHAQVRSATRRSDDYRVHIGYGLVSRSILEIAASSGAGLIVVGHAHAGGWTGGDTAQKLATLSPISLLVVRVGHSSGVVVVQAGASPQAARMAKSEAAMRRVELMSSRGDAVTAATIRPTSLIVVDDASGRDTPEYIVRQAPCSVLIVRGDATR